MSIFLTAWALCMVAACFVILGAVVVGEVRDHYRTGRAVVVPDPVPVLLIPAPRQPSAAVVVEVIEVQSFEDFLRELIVTAHVEEALR